MSEIQENKPNTELVEPEALNLLGLDSHSDEQED